MQSTSLLLLAGKWSSIFKLVLGEGGKRRNGYLLIPAPSKPFIFKFIKVPVFGAWAQRLSQGSGDVLVPTNSATALQVTSERIINCSMKNVDTALWAGSIMCKAHFSVCVTSGQ